MKENVLDELKRTNQEVLSTPSGLSITVTKSLPVSEYDRVWHMVTTGFSDLNHKSYEKQDMSREELEKDLASDDVLKYVARDKEGLLQGFLTVHIGFDDVVWTDTSSQKAMQENVDPDAVPFYVGTLVVPVDRRGTGTAEALIKGSLIHFKEVNSAYNQDSLVFFDCADANYPWLGEFIQQIGSPSQDLPDLDTKVCELYTDAWVKEGDSIVYQHNISNDTTSKNILDKQHYYAISISRY